MKVRVIGIAGASASGKTTLAKALQSYLGDDCCAILSVDAYYHDLSHLPKAERIKTNFDIPEALDFRLLVEHVKSLKDHRSIPVPSYDFKTQCRSQKTMELKPHRCLIIEGMLIFAYPELLSELDFNVYIDVDETICFQHRFLRDIAERGFSKEMMHEKYQEQNYPMFLKYVLPTKALAHLIIVNNAEANVSAHTFLGEIKRILSSVMSYVAPSVPKLLMEHHCFMRFFKSMRSREEESSGHSFSTEICQNLRV